MDKRHDTTRDGLMEQLIESGAENIGTVFARLFERAMQIERERFLGAQHYERSPSRQGYANGYKAKRVDTPAGTITVNVPKTGCSRWRALLPPVIGTRASVDPCRDAGGGRDVF